MRFVGDEVRGMTPDGAGRGADRGTSVGAAGGGAEGGPAAHGDRVRRRCALRQPRRRGQAEVVLHLLVRPEAARRARRGGDAAAARGDRADRRARTASGGRSSRCASTRRRPTASRRRGLELDGRGGRGRRVPADAGVLPPRALERQDGDGDRADDPVGLPDLPDRAPPLPVLRREGGVPLLRHQPQLAPAQAGRAVRTPGSSRSRTCSRRSRSSPSTTTGPRTRTR